MADLIITPSTGKIEFIHQGGQAPRIESIILHQEDGLVFSGKISASSVTAPLNVINVTAGSSNVNYPFIFASSGETGAKSLLMDSAGGTYNPSTNTATIDVSGNSATTTLASNSTQLGGVDAASYVTLTGTQTLTNKTITGTFTGNLTGTSSWASNATNALQLGGTAAASYVTLTGTQTLTGKTITGTFTGNLTGTSSWSSNAVTSLACTGNAATVTNGAYLNTAQTFTAIATFAVPSRTISYTTPSIQLYTGDNTPPGIAFHRGGVSATYLYESGGELYTNPWTAVGQTGKLLAAGNYTDYTVTKTGTGASGNWTITSSWATNALTATNSTQLNGQAASYYTDINARLGYTPVNKAGDTVTGNLIINGNFSVNGSFTAFSASNVYISSSQLYIEDNILTLNAFSPYLRYAGVEMYDSGSGTLSSLLWDGEADYFFLTGSSVNGKIITGPDGQTNLTANFVPKATAGYKLGNSLIYDDGTNVGIGTTVPSTKFHVVGNAEVGDSTADTGLIIRHGSGAAQYGRIRFYSTSTNINTIHSFPTAWNSGTFLNSSAGALNLGGTNGVTFGSWNNVDVAFAQGGNNYFKNSVGIGTTVPASLLHVYSTSAEPAIRLTSTSGSAKTYGLVCNTPWAPGSLHIYDYTADASRIHISSNGNVGIGVGATSPGYKLEVIGSIRSSFAHYNTSTDLNSLRGNLTTMGYSLTNTPSGAGWITVYTSQNNGGDIISQLGYDNYNQQKLFTRYSADFGATWSAWKTIINSDALSGTTNYVPKFSGTNSIGNSLIYDNGTNVGIGTTSPSKKLHVIGSLYWDFNGTAAEEHAVGIQRTVAAANGAYTEIGSLAASPSSNRATFEIFHHDCNTIEYSLFELISNHYAGTTTDWVQLPSRTQAHYAGDRNGVVVDARLASNGANVQLRLRSIGGACGAMIVNVRIKSNTNLTETSATGTGATVAGLLGFNRYEFPVTNDRFKATTEGLFILNNGNIGIGTTGPIAKLEAYGGSMDPTLTPGDPSIFSVNSLGVQLAVGRMVTSPFSVWLQGKHATVGGGLTYPIVLNPLGGFVGIGTTSPTQKLHVAGDALIASSATAGNLYFGDTSLYVRRDNSYDLSLVQAADSNSALYLVSAGSVYLNIDSNNNDTDKAFIVQNNALKAGTELFRVQENGNVGIGTTSPGTLLNVHGATPFVRINTTATADHGIKISYGNSDTHGLHLLYNANSAVSYIDNTYPVNAGFVYGDIYFRQNVAGTMTTRMTIKADGGGNVGIGTTSPGYKLDVNGPIGISGFRFVDQSTHYFRIFEPAGNIALYLGNATDPANYYDNTSHTFRNRGGSSNYVTINSSGNVGIGTTSPASRLHVVGSEAYIRVTDSDDSGVFFIGNASGFGYIRAFSRDFRFLNAAGTSLINIASGGNIGIGTTGPSARLHVFDSNESPATGNLLVTSTGGNASIRIDSQNTSKYTYFTLSQGGVGKFELGITPTSSDLYINHNVQSGANGAAIYIKKADGNVGIGTTAPGAPLTIYKASNPWIRVNGGGAFSYIQLDDGASYGYLFKNTSSDTSNGALAGAMYTYTDSGKAFQHIHSGTPLFTILSGGNVGIGSTSPGYKLDVVGDINFSSTLKFGGINVISNASGDVYLNGRVIRNESNSSQDGMYIGYNSTGTTNAHIRFYANAGNERMRIQANDGHVGIGTSSAGRRLDVEGIVRTRGASGSGGFEIGAATTGTAKWRIEWDSASDSLDFNWVG